MAILPSHDIPPASGKRSDIKRSSSTSVHEADSRTPTNHGRENSAAARSNQSVTNRTQQGRGQANEGHGPVSQVNLFKF